MTVAVAAETRISHSVARVSAAPAVAPRSLSRQVRDSRCHGELHLDARCHGELHPDARCHGELCLS